MFVSCFNRQGSNIDFRLKANRIAHTNDGSHECRCGLYVTGTFSWPSRRVKDNIDIWCDLSLHLLMKLFDYSLNSTANTTERFMLKVETLRHFQDWTCKVSVSKQTVFVRFIRQFSCFNLFNFSAKVQKLLGFSRRKDTTYGCPPSQNKHIFLRLYTQQTFYVVFRPNSTVFCRKLLHKFPSIWLQTLRGIIIRCQQIFIGVSSFFDDASKKK